MGGPPPPPPEAVPTCGAERSFVTAFLRALPLVMSERRAFWAPKKRILLAGELSRHFGVNKDGQVVFNELCSCHRRAGAMVGSREAEEVVEAALLTSGEEVEVEAEEEAWRQELWTRCALGE